MIIVTEDKHGIVTLCMGIDESIALQDILKHQKSVFAKDIYKALAKKDRGSK